MSKIVNFVKNNKIQCYFCVTWFIGMFSTIMSSETENIILLYLGLLTMTGSSLGLLYSPKEIK